MANETAHTGTSVEHPAGGHGPFPPFDKQTFPSQLLWLTVTFAALYLLMSRIALPRIASILESRRTRISGDLAEALRFKGESDAAIAAYEKSLADARGRAQALVNDARQKQAAEAEARQPQVPGCHHAGRRQLGLHHGWRDRVGERWSRRHRRPHRSSGFPRAHREDEVARPEAHAPQGQRSAAQ